MIRTILFVGKPGSGKETQTKLLAQKTGYSVLSTGEKFRELREHRGAIGEHVRREYDTGRLMPDWFADYLFQDSILNQPVESGILFEGSGRSVGQAEVVDTVCKWLGREYIVVHLKISDEEALKRLMGRARSDSNTEDKIRVRLSEFERVTAPALEYYRSKGTLLEIDGERTIEEIHADVAKHFGV